MARVCRVHHGSRLLVADACENSRRHFEHRRLHAQHGGRRCDLEADQPPADDQEIAAASKRRPQRAGIRLRPQVVHARHSERELRNLPRRRSGRDDQRVVMQPPAIVQHDRAIGAVDRRALRERLQHDVMAGHAAGPGDQRVIGRHASKQHRFRERRLFVRLAVLAGEQSDGGGRILLLGSDGGERAGRSAADHEDLTHRSCRSGRSGRSGSSGLSAEARVDRGRVKADGSGGSGARQARSAVSMSSMYSSLSAITTISDHGRSCASVFDSALGDPGVAPTTKPVVMTRRRLHAWPTSDAPCAWPPGPATRTTRSAAPGAAGEIGERGVGRRQERGMRPAGRRQTADDAVGRGVERDDANVARSRVRRLHAEACFGGRAHAGRLTHHKKMADG